MSTDTPTTTAPTRSKAKRAKGKTVVRTSLQKRSLRYHFTREESFEIARRLAERTNEIATLEDEKSRATKDYTARIKTVENDVALLSQRVREGYEFRDIDVEVKFDTPEPGKKTIIRLDTKEVVEVCAMNSEERQASLADLEKTFEGDGKITAMPGAAGAPVDQITAAIDVLRQTKRASTSMIQRRLKIGYNEASRIMDELEKRGIVGPGDGGSAPREIKVNLDLYGQTTVEPRKKKAGKPGVVDVPADK